MRNYADKMSYYQEIGLKWEGIAAELLTVLGYDVEPWSGSWTEPFDLRVNGAAVEVKASYKGDRDNGAGYISDRWQFNLTAKANTDEPWFLILVAIDEKGLETWFFIPGDKVKTATISLTSHPMKYSGQWTEYRSELDWLDSFLKGREI